MSDSDKTIMIKLKWDLTILRCLYAQLYFLSSGFLHNLLDQASADSSISHLKNTVCQGEAEPCVGREGAVGTDSDVTKALQDNAMFVCVWLTQ